MNRVVLMPNTLSTTPLTDRVRDVTNGASRKGLTITRLIGSLQVSSNLVGTAPDWVAGLMVAPNGVSLDPAAEFNSPWLWWQSGSVRSNNMDLGRFDFDLKAKRTFRGGEDDFRFQFKNTDPVDAIIFAFSLRTLYLLP